MSEIIKINSTIKWTLQSVKESIMNNEEFFSFVDDMMDIDEENSHITGTIIGISKGSAIVQVADMTPGMFPFTLFANEVENRYAKMELKDKDPYLRFFCLDVKSMTSLFYYDMGSARLAYAEYDADGNFVDYDFEEEPADYDDLIIPDGSVPEQITVRLDMKKIEEMEERDVFLCTDDISYEDVDGFIKINDTCGIARAVSWFNKCDCAILSAWRQDKGRKENDDNNKKLQRELRELGYGVTKITGWYPEENREMARENSFFVVNLNDEQSFCDKIFQQSELYEQDCFLYKKSGYDTPAIYVYTRDVKEYKKGEVKLLGRLRIGNMEAEAYSQIRAGRITFE